MSTARASPETRAPSRNPATAPCGYVQCDRVQCGVELKGQRYRAKGIVAETSKLLQCECALYGGE